MIEFDHPDVNEIANGIVVFDNFTDEYDNLIKKAIEDDGWYTAGVLSDEGTTYVDDISRRNKILHISDSHVSGSDSTWLLARNAVEAIGGLYANIYQTTYSYMEDLQVLHYSSGDGFYKTHTDDAKTAHRVFSAVLYLNDVDEGGETEFPLFGVSVKPVKGRIVFFPSNFIYRHEAKPPLSGDKFAIVTWFRM